MLIMLKVLIFTLLPFFNEGIKLTISKADMKRYWGIYPPSNLYDGITYNFAHSFDESDGMWVRVNLAYRSSIKKILIYNREECCQNRIVGASVYIKAREKDVKKCGTITSTKTLYSFDCEEEGDSVEIRQEGFVNQWNIAEIEVFGSSSEQEILFSIVDENGRTGSSSGLLLYKGGTVCPERFNDETAVFICSLLGYEHDSEVSFWRSMDMHGLYERTLIYVVCYSDKWSSCVYDTTSTCYASDDVYLQCIQEKKSISPEYIVLFVAAILAGVVCAIYYFHNRQKKSTSEDQHDQTREAISDAPVAAVTYSNSSTPNPSVVNVDQSNENINESRFEEPAPALGTDNLPPPQYVYQRPHLKEDEIPSYEEVMANDHIYQKPL